MPTSGSRSAPFSRSTPPGERRSPLSSAAPADGASSGSTAFRRGAHSGVSDSRRADGRRSHCLPGRAPRQRHRRANCGASAWRRPARLGSTSRIWCRSTRWALTCCVGCVTRAPRSVGVAEYLEQKLGASHNVHHYHGRRRHSRRQRGGFEVLTFKDAERLFRVRPDGRMRLKDHDPSWAGGSEFKELRTDELKARAKEFLGKESRGAGRSAGACSMPTTSTRC